ncbi:MFS transporter [Brevibacillus borstelensis]|uniref:MFS transporter n=1 Tax=Brevibacillus borstelensis TaxID=45462 RepID=UPI0030C403EF
MNNHFGSSLYFSSHCFLRNKKEEKSMTQKQKAGASAILYLLGITILIGSFSQNLFLPILPDMQQTFHASTFTINLTVSVFTLMLAAMQLVYGPLVDRIGRRKVLLPALLLFVAASVGCAYAPSIYPLLFFRALQGIGFAAIPIVAATVIGDLFEGAKRADAMGTYQMMLGLGPALGPLLGGWLGAVGGHSLIFLFLAASSLLLLGANGWLLPETRPAGLTPPKKGWEQMVGILPHPVGGSVIFIAFAQMFTYYSFLVFLPAHAAHSYGLTPGEIGVLFLSVSLVFIASSKMSRFLLRFLRIERALLMAAIANAVGTLLFMITANLSLTAMIASSMVYILTLGIGMPLHTAVLSEAFMNERATAIGMYNFVRYVGMAAGPIIGAFLFKLGDSWLQFGFAGLFIAVSAWVGFVRFRKSAAAVRSGS